MAPLFSHNTHRRQIIKLIIKALFVIEFKLSKKDKSITFTFQLSLSILTDALRKHGIRILKFIFIFYRDLT